MTNHQFPPISPRHDLAPKPLPPMPPEVRRLVEAANHGASYASHVHGGHNAVEQIESAIAAIKSIYRSEP